MSGGDGCLKYKYFKLYKNVCVGRFSLPLFPLWSITFLLSMVFQNRDVS